MLGLLHKNIILWPCFGNEASSSFDYFFVFSGGRLVLEAQGFAGYKKRKNLTSRIRENFDNIKLRPESFRDYLIHEVAFVGETIAVPTHPSQGFQRPLQVY